MNTRSSLALFVISLLLGCGKAEIARIDTNSTILAFGDSLTYGYGAEEEESYPAILEGLIGCKVINAGISGERSDEGLNRLPALLDEYQPNLVILCFGGNDMLQNRSLSDLKHNLRLMIEQIRNTGSDILLIGVPKPGLLLRTPDLYKDLAQEFKLPIQEDILSDILSSSSLKSDHIHPNAKGYKLMAETLYERIQ